MTKAYRVSPKWTRFEMPVSWNKNPAIPVFMDCQNVISRGGQLKSRNGIKKLTDVNFGGTPSSITYYENAATGKKFVFALVGTELKRWQYGTAAVETVLGNIQAGSKHRAVDYGNRHVIGIENKGLYLFDGDYFFRAGQEPPRPEATYEIYPTGAGTLSGAVYNLYYTFYSERTGYESAPSEATSFDLTLAASGAIGIFQNDSGERIYGEAPENASISHFRLYLKDVTNATAALFVVQLPLEYALDSSPFAPPGLVYFVAEMPTNTETMPDDGGLPPQTDISDIDIFYDSVAVVSNENPNEVVLSENFDPQHFREDLDGETIYAHGPGPVTAIGVGKYSSNTLAATPYLVIFKRSAVWLYSKTAEVSSMVQLSDSIGCVSRDTISSKKNGDVYFLSSSGWRCIREGKIVSTKTKIGTTEATIDNGLTEEVFSSKGHPYEMNARRFGEFFSAYNEQLNQYITWVVERGQETNHGKAYVYEHQIGGFKIFKFPVNCRAATEGVDNNGNLAILIADDNGWIYQYSGFENYWDEISDDSKVAIPQMAMLYWAPKDGDHARSFAFRELILRGKTGEAPITGKVMMNFARWPGQDQDETEYEYSTDINEGYTEDVFFRLDFDSLDSGKILAEGDGYKTFPKQDINRIGESIALIFEQSAIGASMGLVSCQLEMSANGNRNLF